MSKKIKAMKVLELRDECDRLGIDNKGLRPVLLDRVLKAHAAFVDEVSCYHSCFYLPP